MMGLLCCPSIMVSNLGEGRRKESTNKIMTTTVECQEQVYKVANSSTTADVDNTGNEKSDSTQHHSYLLRGLTDEEVPKWSEFCASVFAYKAFPPSAEYFYRHYANDPHDDTGTSSSSPSSSSLIRVAIFQNEIVASCRIFLRTISLGKNNINNVVTAGIHNNHSDDDNGIVALTAGGIGEVCTATQHRRRGLSKALLQNAIAIMKERQLTISLLHAGPAFFPVYEASGYKCSKTNWSVLELDYGTLLGPDSNHHLKHQVRNARFPVDTERLYQLHQQYSEQRLAGCIIRTREYWSKYLSVELKGALNVLMNDAETIVAWLSIRPIGGSDNNHQNFQLREFGMDSSHTTTTAALGQLLAHALKQGCDSSLLSPTANDNNFKQLISLKIPQFLLTDLKTDYQDDAITCGTTKFWDSECTETDRGWMYLVLDEDVSSSKGRLDSLVGCSNPEFPPHFIWPSDSF